MTITLFITILTIAAAVTSLFTEAIKTYLKVAEKPYSANIIALINAVFVGVGGTAVVYLLINIPFTITNVACMVLMGICVWIGSTIGYDKVMQTIQQITNISNVSEEDSDD